MTTRLCVCVAEIVPALRESRNERGPLNTWMLLTHPDWQVQSPSAPPHPPPPTAQAVRGSLFWFHVTRLCWSGGPLCLSRHSSRVTLRLDRKSVAAAGLGCRPRRPPCGAPCGELQW